MRKVAGALPIAAFIGILSLFVLGGTASGAVLSQFGGVISGPNGESFTQAGAHPDAISTTLEIERAPSGLPADLFKNTEVSLPAGIVGNPMVAPKCPQQVFYETDTCPNTTVVGVAMVWMAPSAEPVKVPIFNMEPSSSSMPAEFAFKIVHTPVVLVGDVRSDSDYGISVASRLLPQALPIWKVVVTFWGNPAAESHDAERGTCLADGGVCRAGLPEEAFLTTPSECSVAPLTTGLNADFWASPSVATNYQKDENGNPVSMEDCATVPFEPTVDVDATTTTAASPSGLNVTLRMPQSGLLNPYGRAPSPIRDVSVTLPQGMAVNTSSADGLGNCSEEQVGYEPSSGHFSEAPARCPGSSKLGTVRIKTPLLPEELEGAVYLATQGSNPFNSLLALYVVAEGSGVVVKLPGDISTDSQTGRLTATFADNPQLPFETLQLQLKSGPRAPLITPASCGTYATQAKLSSWSRPNEIVNSSSSFTIDENCAASAQFTPALEAGTTNPVAGLYSPFTLRLTRPDGQPNVSALEATLPEGLLARLAGVPLCGDAQAATGDCPAASQVGRVIVGAGAGSSPIYVPQPGKAPTGVYLAGPYEGAPYSLVVKVPAQAGPFDLGTVAVRNALDVDPTTTKVTAKSDPLPQILQGIPISYRDVRVEVDRPEFTLNPTSCDPMAVTSTITAVGGRSASPSSRFQSASCESLAFKPSLALSLKGAAKRTGHPALKATLTFPQKGRFANIRRAQVGLPHSLFLDQGNLNKVCRQADLKAGTCPASSVYGKAKAWSPLLDRPLEGPVVLGVGFGHKLPDLVAELNGQIRVLLNGKVDTTRQKGLRNTFEAVPDAPVSKFVIELKGGKKYGLIENSENLCRKAQKASVEFGAQNGKSLHLNPKIAVKCPKKAGTRKRK